MNKQRFLFQLVVIFLMGLVGCEQAETPEPTPIPTVTVGGETAVSTQPPPAPTMAAEETVTEDVVTAVPEPTPTEAVPATPSEPAASPTAAPESSPVTGLFGPGQQDVAALEPGGVKTYTVQGVQFQPLYVFAETVDEADVVITAVAGENPSLTNLDDVTPLPSADFNPPARPEVMVFSPPEDGLFTLIVGNEGSEAGEIAVYLFDAATDTPLATHYRDQTLAAGAKQSYAVQSKGGRPVVAFLEPQDQSDLILKFLNDDGGTANEANYSGPGSAEAAFVLPLRITDYTIEVTEAAGGAATYTLIVITLE